LKLHHLRDFVAVARTGGIRPAARELKLSQPAISKSIQLLEQELGAPLFRRGVKGSVLNEYGRAFLVRAAAAMHELDRGRDEVQHMSGNGTGTVCVAASTAVSLMFLPAVIKEFNQRFPKVNVSVLEGTYPAICQGLQEGSLDFAVGPMTAPGVPDGLMVEALFDNELCVVARHKHPLGRVRSLASLVDAHWIVTAAVGPRYEDFIDIFVRNGLAVPTRRTRCESYIALLALVAGSDGIALMPRQWADSPVTRQLLARIPVAQNIPGPSTYFMTRRGLPLTPAADALATSFRKAIARYASGA
jgi:LysR family transcriptional regulator of abg operon